MPHSTAPLRAFKPDRVPLTVELARAGWAEGAPPGVSLFSVAVDAWCCGQMVCPACPRKGMLYKPHHKGGAYKVVAACPCCGAQEEF